MSRRGSEWTLFFLLLALFLACQLSEGRRSGDRGESQAREQLRPTPAPTTTKKPKWYDRFRDKGEKEEKKTTTTTTKRPPTTTTPQTRNFGGKGRGDSEARKALLTTTTQATRHFAGRDRGESEARKALLTTTTLKPYGWAIDSNQGRTQGITTTRRPGVTNIELNRLELERTLEKQREKELQREVERQREMERQREKEWQWEMERQRGMERLRERERQWEMERQREREWQWEMERQRERTREWARRNQQWTTPITPREIRPDLTRQSKAPLPYRQTAFGSGFSSGTIVWGWSSSHPRPSVSQLIVARSLFSADKNAADYGSDDQSNAVYRLVPSSLVQEKRRQIMQNQSTTASAAAAAAANATDAADEGVDATLSLLGDDLLSLDGSPEGNETASARVITDPTQPILVQDVAFFWDAHFLPKKERGCVNYSVVLPASSFSTNIQFCNIPTLTRCTRELKELGGNQTEALFFPNGTAPSHLAWFCPARRSCCGWECCEEKRGGGAGQQGTGSGHHSTLIIFLLLLAVTLLLCCCCGRLCYRKARIEYSDRKYRQECEQLEKAQNTQ